MRCGGQAAAAAQGDRGLRDGRQRCGTGPALA
jgi:hypothetical protein